MVDFFKVLDLPQRASLDADEISKRFQQKSKEVHPDSSDRPDAEAFAQINEANQTLSDSARRLKHLLELRFPGEDLSNSAMDAELMDVFAKVGMVIHSLDDFLKKKRRATTELAKALLANEQFALQEQLEESNALVREKIEEAEASLPEIDKLFENHPNTLPELARSAHQKLAFLKKWQTQLQERFGELLA